MRSTRRFVNSVPALLGTGSFGTLAADNTFEIDVVQFNESGWVLWQLLALSVSQAESIVWIRPGANDVKF
jgi:hypothetical protein